MPPNHRNTDHAIASQYRAVAGPVLVPDWCRASDVSRGTVFVKDAIPLPSWFAFPFQLCGTWKRLVNVDGYDVELAALRAGRRFSYIASPTTASAIGLRRQSAMDRALKRVVEAVSRSGFNSFEVTQIATRRLLGFHYARVEAHPRLPCPSPFLRQLNPYRYTNVSENFEPISWRAADVEPDVRGI